MTVHTYILEYNNIAKTNAQLARSVIDLVLDPVEKENLLSAIDALGANHEEFLQQAQEALKSPGDTQKEFLLLELIEKSQETTRNVRHTIDQVGERR